MLKRTETWIASKDKAIEFILRKAPNQRTAEEVKELTMLIKEN